MSDAADEQATPARDEPEAPTCGGFPSPEDFALAVQKDAVLGPVVEGSVTVADSTKGCIEAICTKLEKFGLHPTTMTNHTNLAAIRKIKGAGYGRNHQSVCYKPGKNRTPIIHLYCKKCMNINTPDPDLYRASLVAIVSVTTIDDPHQISAELLAVYPHCSECDKPHKLRTSYLMDKENGGDGWAKLTAPVDDIVGETLSPIVEKLRDIPWDAGEEEHKGTRIVNKLKQQMPEWEWDLRWYLPLFGTKEEPGVPKAIRDFYSLGDDIEEELNRMRLRLTLFLANTLNAPTEFAPIPEFFNRKYAAPTPVSIGERDKRLYGEPQDAHVSLEKDSVIGGGFQWQGKLTNQPDHFDMQNIASGKRQPREYSVTENPALKNHIKPFSTSMPLSVEGRRMIINYREVQINYGELVVFAGDVSHAGYTLPKTRIPRTNYWSPTYHCYFTSTRHAIDLDKFVIDVEGLARRQPHLLGYALTSVAVAELKKASTRLCHGLEAARQNEGGSVSIDNIIAETIVKLQRMRPAAETTGTEGGEEGSEEAEGVSTRTRKRRQH